MNGRLSAYIQILSYFSYCCDSLHVGQPRVINPHTFGHGLAVYNTQQAKNISDQKAISINLMHSDSEITDGIYSIQINIELRNRIKGMMVEKMCLRIIQAMCCCAPM